jgi:hypothetical protein
MNTTLNPQENFEAVFEKERKLQEGLEKIEVAYVKTVEKYGEYSDCKSFAEFLRTIEKIFLEAKFRNWDGEKSKDELIKAKMKMMAESSSIGEDILLSIYNDFKKSGVTIAKIYEIVAELLKKYGEHSECGELILYIQYLFINFNDAEEKRVSVDDLKDRLIRARMDVLSSDGDPNLVMLENIYKEFKILLNAPL